jgi:hypothetical protein
VIRKNVTVIERKAAARLLSFRYRRAAFYSGLKSKVGLIAAKTAALRVNMNTDGCLLASHVASLKHPKDPKMLVPIVSGPVCMFLERSQSPSSLALYVS